MPIIEVKNNLFIVVAGSLNQCAAMQATWHGLNDYARSEQMLNAALEHIKKSRKLQSGGFSSGVDDVIFLTVLGNYIVAHSPCARAQIASNELPFIAI
ncbi:hypothetical protein PN836_017710 [Ningiella sp. W23]|uniref:hypothetical protein n=1 Tax=Ningiella sp. W23 TaxID=3023715 RepID=UPI003757A5F3